MESDNYFESLNQLHRRLNDLDERGLVLTLAAFAEDSLADLLTAFMLDNPASKKLVGGYDAPLGTLSSRIGACYALGLITKGQYHDLEHLRSIRNKFSHTWKPISFDDQEVKNKIQAMHYSNLIDTFPETLRQKIEGSISVLLLEIKVAIGQIQKRHTRAAIQGSRIYSGINGTTDEQIQKCRERLQEINSEIEGAKAEYKVFLMNRKRLWLEKYHRAASNGPRESFEGNHKGMFDFASPEEASFASIYNRDL